MICIEGNGRKYTSRYENMGRIYTSVSQPWGISPRSGEKFSFRGEFRSSGEVVGNLGKVGNWWGI